MEKDTKNLHQTIVETQNELYNADQMNTFRMIDVMKMLNSFRQSFPAAGVSLHLKTSCRHHGGH